MKSEREVLSIDPDSETGELLKLVGNEPVTVECEGVRYRISRDPFANHDPDRVLAALRQAQGIFRGMDVEEFKREIRRQRGHDDDE